MNLQDTKKRLQEANKLLLEKSTSAEKLESLSVILKGLNPKLDQVLKDCTESFSKIESIQKGDVIALSASSLPENSEEEKKRKKAILAFIRTWEDLKSEVEQIQTEFENSQNPKQQAHSLGKIITAARGPFGLVTIAAVVIVGFIAITNLNNNTQVQNPASQPPTQPGTTSKSKIKAIIFNDKKIPLTQLKVATGPECDQAEHYHAINGASSQALDGSTVPDPGGCGYGKTKEVTVVEQ